MRQLIQVAQPWVDYGMKRASENGAVDEQVVQQVNTILDILACFRDATQVARLPKTRSGKILRGTMRAIAGGKDYNMPSTIDDPVILDEIQVSLKQIGYANEP